MLRLRREVELPARMHERAWFYIGLGSFLLSLSIIVDASLWAGPTVAAERAVTARHLRTRPPCAARPPAAPRAAHGEFHQQLVDQLDHPWAAADYLDPGGRYGKMNSTDPAFVPPPPRRR